MTVTEQLVHWGLTLEPTDVPKRVRHAAARHLLDGIGCAVAAHRLESVPAAVATAAGLGGDAEATVVGTGRRVGAPAAALANGALIHGLDFDDTHAGALIHATAAVAPAALAVGEEHGRTGEEVLTACVVGYEVVNRLGAAIPHGFHARGFHATSVCGVFAAALVAARLSGLDEQRAVAALGIAGSQAAGSLEFLNTGSSTKQLHPGLSGMAGVLAARLAAAGASGPSSIVEGEYGLFRSYLGVAVDPELVSAGLGRRWETEEITIKPYPNCQLLHASLDALEQAMTGTPADAGSIAEIAFELPADAVPIVCEPAGNKRRPRTPYEAKFSLAWSAAALAIDGRVDLDTYLPSELDRTDVAGLADRVTYAAYDPDGVAADAAGRVVVTARDGTVRRGEVARSRGGPSRPLTDEELAQKFVANAGGSDDARQLAAALLAIDRAPEVSGLLARTAPPLRTGTGASASSSQSGRRQR